LRVDQEQDLDHKLGGSTWVDLSQRMNKNDYYHNFKPDLKVELGKVYARKVNIGLPKKNQGSLILT
jgi:hypothetical protein